MMPFLALYWRGAIRFAVRADWLSLPANTFQMSYAVGCGGKAAVNFNDVHGYLLLRQKQG